MKSLEGKIILHIGNVANNAYNAAAFDRSKNLTAFAISPDYLHVMAFPFWETEEIMVEPENTFHPEAFMNSANMPEWFVHGSWSEIYQKLILLLNVQNKEPIRSPQFILQIIKMRDASINYLLKKTRHLLKKILPNKIKDWLANTTLIKLRRHPKHFYTRIFNLADVIVFYGHLNAYASVSKWKGRYISLEHGTLRDFLNSGYWLSQKSKEGYIKSFRTIVTNQDCYKPAIELGIKESTIIKSPHPSSDFDFSQMRQIRRQVLSTRPIEIFSATRHSYGSNVDRGKGNEIAIDGILKSLKKFPRLRSTFVESGDDVIKSKRFIK